MIMPEVKVLVEGGKATAAPPLGPALGPLGVNIGQVIGAINDKTKIFSGMQVPVTVKVKDDKSFSVDVGTPPVSALVKKEAGLEKLSGRPKDEKFANIKVEQCIKVAKMKIDVMGTSVLKKAVKEIAGSCVSYGILIENKDPKDFIKDVDKGMYDEQIKSEKTEITAEQKKQLDEDRKRLAKQVEVTRQLREKLEAEKKAAEEAAKAVAATTTAAPVEEKKEEKKEAAPADAKKAEPKKEEKKEEKKK